MTPTWLLIWSGGGITAEEVAVTTAAVTTSDESAHHLYFTEHGGPRCALLLVHWTAVERDQVLRILEPRWGVGFVNEVHDLAD